MRCTLATRIIITKFEQGMIEVNGKIVEAFFSKRQVSVYNWEMAGHTIES
ncbi:MAG TPA: hypothetical protein VGK38_08815 [Prolixibacteraceae bacterium]